MIELISHATASVLEEASAHGEECAGQIIVYLPSAIVDRCREQVLVAMRFCYKAGILRGREER